MSNRDPMISHGSIINTDANLTVRKQGPVLLQHRIKSDSTKKPDIVKPTEEGVFVTMAEQNEARRRKQEKYENERTKGRKQETEHESPFVEDLPLFVMVFMALLIIFKLIAEATVEVPHYAVTVLSMAASIFMIFT